MPPAPPASPSRRTPSATRGAAPASTAGAAPSLSRRADAVGSSRIRELLRLVERPGVLSLAGGLPAPSALDAGRVAAAATLAFDHVGALGPTALQYGPTEGTHELRSLIAAQHDVAIDQVLITTGSQQAIDLLARTLGDAGDVVAVEAPSYLGALQSFAAAELQVLAIDGDDDGFSTDALEHALDNGLSLRLVYVVPNFHNPTGTVLPLERRRRLAELSEEHGFFVVEDDPYGELDFAGAATASIGTARGEPFATPGAGHVVRVGSASKVLAPGLRVGWMVAPEPVIDAATRRKQAADLHTPSLNQLIVATLLQDEPNQRAHLEEIRRLYRERAGALHAALIEHLGDRVRVRRPTGGMFAWATATDDTDTHALFPHALDHGVAYVPGTAFAPDGHRFRDGMRLSFATLAPADLDEAAARLAAAWVAAG